MKVKTVVNFLFTLMVIMVFTCFPVFAKNADTAFLRVRIEYESEKGDVMPLPDECFEISDKWAKEERFWYYQDPVKTGETIEFLRSVQIPHEWDSQSSKETFHLVIYADAAENVNGQAAWEGFINNLNGKYSRAINLDLTMNEYELDENGNYIPYQNNKNVLPGDKIEKHVLLTPVFTYKSPSSSSSSSSGPDDEPDEIIKPVRIEYPVISERPAQPENTPVSEKPPAPTGTLTDTGDHFNMVVYILAAIISLTGFVFLIVKKKKL
ncbi:MAG: hypothetical protein IJO13_08560 [Lachnospiraceae bacterium]|nr:hypothetical protein [Lachnospiraceae bacterium]